uniref:MYND-type domain-containing protein n=1 Tax=Chromera velia CCMP2878 TaxID=1169474 RepID=A0A0G4G2Z2_9ALVE|eukprot:Cvel_19998.t1-p1 / transcript=Cvel_19998.t1 / gene=Cvel_19998 / organism=Chromera_velia_CCMP2878 / gene_product=hypothetical protein / transcript_product=hypothetical protein / location=Cvel_scaffold1762:27418-29259(-) / protein_length=519 / sequence_SO=supercontig / SO=protein_coding / is_pseudo=false
MSTSSVPTEGGQSSEGSSDGLIPDFLLVGGANIRQAIVGLVELKTLVEAVFQKLKQDYANAKSASEGSTEAEVAALAKGFMCRLLRIWGVLESSANKSSAEFCRIFCKYKNRLSSSSSEACFATVVQEVLYVKGLFHTALWLFTVKTLIPPTMLESVSKRRAFHMIDRQMDRSEGKVTADHEPTHRIVISRDIVIRLNNCAPPESSVADKAPLEFSPLFRILFEHAQKPQPEEGRKSKDVISLWMADIAIFEVFGMAQQIRRGFCTAFRSPENVNDALSLYRATVKAVELGVFWGYTMKAFEMSIQNLKVVKLILKDKMKALKVFRTVQNSKKKTEPAPCQVKNPNPFVEGKVHQVKICVFFDLLIYCLESLLTKAQRKALKCADGLPTTTVFIQWLQSKRKEPLAKLPLSSLSAFVDQMTDAQIVETRRKAEQSENKERPSSSMAYCGSDPSFAKPSSDNTTSAATVYIEEPFWDTNLDSRKQMKKATCFPCDNCRKEIVKVKSCAVCQLAVYCSRKC